MKPLQRKPSASTAKPLASPALDEAAPAATKPPAASKKAKPVAPHSAEPKTVAAAIPAPAETPAASVTAASVTPAALVEQAVAEVLPTPEPVSPSTSPTAKVPLMSALPNAPFKGYDDFTAFSKANVDAFIQANQVLAKGFEEISKEMISLTQASMETAAAAAKAVFTAKTFKDVVEMNSDYTKSSFDKFVSNSTKLSEMGVKVATDAFAPVTARVNVAVEKMLKPSA